MPKEAKELLNFPSELYVGTKNLQDFNTVDPPLGFATPYGKDKAFEKRKETVDHWCGDGTKHEYVKDADGEFVRDTQGRVVSQKIIVGMTQPQTIQNTPMSGFSFDRAIERYSTSNKVFRITDPRGFQLEIAADNLADILLNCEVSKGNLVGDFIWGRLGGSNFLTRVDHPSYQRFLKPALTRTKLQPGDHVYLSNRPTEMVYCGEFFIFRGETTTLSVVYDRVNRFRQQAYYSLSKIYDEKPFKVFKSLANLYNPYSLLRNPSKVIILSENNPLPTDMPLNGVLSKLDYAGVSSFFATKDEMLAFNPSFDDMRLIFERARVEHFSLSYSDYIYLPPGTPIPGKYGQFA